MPDALTPAAPAATVASALPGADLRALLAVPWRRRATIVAVTGLGVGLTALALLLATPRYTASTLVMVAAPPARVVAMDAVLAGAPADAQTVFTEAEVLHARALLHTVATAHGIYDDPEFNPALTPPGLLGTALRALPEGWDRLLLGRPLPRDPAGPEAHAAALDTFREAVAVKPVHRSRVIAVQVESERPARAAALANALAEAYLTAQLEAKFDATRRANAWLDARIAALRDEVRLAEQAVADYRAAHGLTEARGTALTSQQMAEVNSQLILAKSRRSEAEARLAAMRGARDPATAPEAIASPLVQKLKEQETAVLRRQSELAARYGDKHPRMIDVTAELDDLRRKIAAEVSAIAKGLENEVRVARAREDSLVRSLAELQGRDAREDEAAITLRELEREAEATRLMYESFLARFKETTQQQSLQEPDARIVSAAVAPVEPSFPRRLPALLVAVAASLAAGVALAFLRERLDRALRTAADVEAATGRPPLAMIPLAPRGRPVPDAVLDAPAEAAAEAVRTLRAALMVKARGAPLGVVAVTSSLPEEGKTTLALWLARAAAQAGRSAVLVDCDLRRPSVAAALGLAEGPTLVDVLAGTADLESALVADPRSALTVLPAGRAGFAALDIAEAPALADLLATLKARFEVVVVDAPPVLPVADGRLLARRADHVLFAVRWEDTPREVAAEGVRALLAAGVEPLPVVTRVDLARHARYGYGDAAGVYGRYASYYGARRG
ncbi:Wzz/FepE/Etk N-terminal domain-containing protein [Caenispirillum bisanense]|uniref:non-specific protein-tyrosine kinase n=1 Tax=Caenispirillum bisanense TaxID=414052 RepID=A0A286GNR9_9PROT|nr:Wzz/FepE/Etk N-terminal domain-containing protein [Caenispirillum bisanense]SOD97201.1 Uncharacterized protein involved in exopolysaccharide biosynthesis [Caenispirillum bisanense]